MNFGKVIEIVGSFLHKHNKLCLSSLNNVVLKRFKRVRLHGYGPSCATKFEYNKVIKREWTRSLIYNFGVEKNFGKAVGLI